MEGEANLEALDRVIADAVFLALDKTGRAKLPLLGQFERTESSIAFTPSDELLDQLPKAQIGTPPSEQGQAIDFLANILQELFNNDLSYELSFEPTRLRLRTVQGWQDWLQFDSSIGRQFLALLANRPITTFIQPFQAESISLEFWPRHRPISAHLHIQSAHPLNHISLAPTSRLLLNRLRNQAVRPLYVLVGSSAFARQAARAELLRLIQPTEIVERMNEPIELALLEVQTKPQAVWLFESPSTPADYQLFSQYWPAETPAILESRLPDATVASRLFNYQAANQSPFGAPAILGASLVPAVCPVCAEPAHLCSQKLFDAVGQLPVETKHHHQLNEPQFMRNRGCEQCQGPASKHWLCFEMPTENREVNREPADLQKLLLVYRGHSPVSVW